MITQRPIRTCIGCRERAAAAELLRVVVAPDAIGEAGPSGQPGRALTVVPDPRQRLPGRGAWLHPDPRCAELAQRRRAFARALRVPGPTDAAPVLAYLAAGTRPHEQQSGQQRNPVGELDGLTMKRQQ